MTYRLINFLGLLKEKHTTQEIVLPQWSMEMQDATIVRWLKQEGDPVQEGEPLVELERATWKPPGGWPRVFPESQSSQLRGTAALGRAKSVSP